MGGVGRRNQIERSEEDKGRAEGSGQGRAGQGRAATWTVQHNSWKLSRQSSQDNFLQSRVEG